MGRVWVLNFFFTSCPLVCPVVNGRISQLVQKYSDNPDVRFLSLSIDPERDTPAVLSEYAKRFNADPNRWAFLTGDLASVKHLMRDVFNLGAFDDVNLHSTRLILIDRSMQIRGFYQGNDSESLSELDAQIGKLLVR